MTGLLVGAISYALGVCALVGPDDMTLPTPCADWDLGMLLAHLSDSMADLETLLRTGHLDLDQDLERPPDHGWDDPVETRPDRFVAIGGLPVPAGLVACTGAMEIAVHGWDVSAARGGEACPIPAALATRMLRLSPLLVAGREGLFGVPVDMPAQASPGDRLIGYLGRRPGNAVIVTGE